MRNAFFTVLFFASCALGASLYYETPLKVTASGSSSLLTGLQAYYNFDQTSSPSTDSTSNHIDMTWNNSPTSVTGLIGNGLHFPNTGTTYLISSANAAMNLAGGSFTNAGWIKLDAGATTEETSLVRWTNNCATSLTWYDIQAGTASIFQIRGSGGVHGLSGPNLSLNAWHLIVVWYDHPNQLQWIQVDNGTASSTPMTDTLAESNNDCTGAEANLGISGNYAVDETGYWSRILTSGERTTLYKSGAGVTYPTFALNDVLPFMPKTLASARIPQSPFVLASFAR